MLLALKEPSSLTGTDDMKRLKSAALLLPLLALSACTHHLSSAELHAKHYIYQTRDDFDPQFRTDVNGSIKNAVPMFEQFYQLGKKDRAAGVVRSEAQKKADYLASPEFQQNMEHKTIFINRTYSSADNPKRRQVFSQEAVGAYWDGYEGR
ncbi:hypothetical protein GCM10009132_13130 [Serratia ureilytica]